MRSGGVFLMLLFMLLINGCRKQEVCAYMKCNMGTCQEGICQCPVGYEGAECAVLTRTKYLGTFEGGEASCTATDTGKYIIKILPDASNKIAVIIENIWGANGTSIGVVGSDGNIYIAYQDLYADYKITGKVMLLNGKLKVVFSILPNSVDNCVWLQD